MSGAGEPEAVAAAGHTPAPQAQARWVGETAALVLDHAAAQAPAAPDTVLPVLDVRDDAAAVAVVVAVVVDVDVEVDVKVVGREVY